MLFLFNMQIFSKLVNIRAIWGTVVLGGHHLFFLDAFGRDLCEYIFTKCMLFDLYASF